MERNKQEPEWRVEERMRSRNDGGQYQRYRPRVRKESGRSKLDGGQCQRHRPCLEERRRK